MAKPQTLYVEVVRPSYPQRGLETRIHKDKAFSRDVLSHDMTCVFRVEYVTSKDEALALIAEKLAGKNGACVTKIFG